MTLGKLAVLGALGAGLAGIGTYGVATAPAKPAPTTELLGINVNRLFNDRTYSLAEIDAQLAASWTPKPKPRNVVGLATQLISGGVDEGSKVVVLGVQVAPRKLIRTARREDAHKARRQLLEEVAKAGEGDDDLLQFVRRRQAQTYVTLDKIQEVLKAGAETPVPPPPNAIINFNMSIGVALANKLQLVARLIDKGFGTRVFYVNLDGFDTPFVADAATVPPDGKFYALGGGFSALALPSLPGLASFAVVAGFRFTTADAGAVHLIELRFVDSLGKLVLPPATAGRATLRSKCPARRWKR